MSENPEDDPLDETEGPASDGEDGERRGSRFSRLARRLIERDLSEDARELLGNVVETSDRAKSEFVRLTAQEIRNYLEALQLKEEVLRLVTSHSLEVHLSLNLKPLADALEEEETPAEPIDSDEPLLHDEASEE